MEEKIAELQKAVVNLSLVIDEILNQIERHKDRISDLATAVNDNKRVADIVSNRAHARIVEIEHRLDKLPSTVD